MLAVTFMNGRQLLPPPRIFYEHIAHIIRSKSPEISQKRAVHAKIELLNYNKMKSISYVHEKHEHMLPAQCSGKLELM